MDAGFVFDYREHLIFVDTTPTFESRHVGVFRIAQETGDEVHRGRTPLTYETAEAGRASAAAVARDVVDQLVGYVTNEKEVDGLHVSFLLWRRGDVWACRVLRSALYTLASNGNAPMIATFYENRELIIQTAVRHTVNSPHSNAVILAEADFLANLPGTKVNAASLGRNSGP